MTIKESNQNGDMEWMRRLTRFNQKPVPVIDVTPQNEEKDENTNM